MRKEKKRQAKYYNRKARNREMKVGDKALVLLPTKNNKLLSHGKVLSPLLRKLDC